MGCYEISMTFEDLLKERAELKNKEIQNFDNANPLVKSGTVSSDSQTITPVNNKEFKDCEREFFDLKIVTAALLNQIDELMVQKETLYKDLNEKKIRLNVLEEKVKENKLNQDKELKEFSDNQVKHLKELDDDLRRKIEEAEKRFTERSQKTNGFNKRPNANVSAIQTGNLVVRNELIGNETQCSPQFYLAEICSKLQANLYYLVLPDQFAEDCTYRVKDIEEDINDEDLLDVEERKEASKRWEDLKTKIQWDPSLMGTLKLLQNATDSMDEPPCLDVDEAKNVAETLNKQGRLKGRISYKRVQKIIEMWSISDKIMEKKRNL